MQIVKNLKENTSHRLTGAGAYEWWYFDCIDEDNEYSFATKFLTGNPFSNEYSENVKEHINFPELKKPEMLNYCSLSFSLYHKSRTVYSINYDYKKNNFVVESENGDEKIYLDKSFFSFLKNDNKYYLNINLTAADPDRKFKAEFLFTVVSENPAQEINDNISIENKHFWLPAASICDVSGKFKFHINSKRMKTEFNGSGYHDHHWGDEALFINMQNWYWGRVITDNYSLVYLYIKYFDKDKLPFKKLIIYKKGEIISELDEFNFDIKNKLSISALNFNKDIVVTAKGVKMICSNKTRLEDGTLNMRYLSAFDLKLDDKDVIKGETGISEFISQKKFTKDP